MNDKEFDYLGITKFHKLGYKGQGIVIASREKEFSDHGAKVGNILKQVCPEATILYDVDYRKRDDFDVYTTSLSFSSDKLETYKKKAKELTEKNIFLCCAAGNEGVASQSAISKNEYFKAIGACHLRDGKPEKAYYSSVTEDLDYMSFSNLETDIQKKKIQGTSFATPLFAAMVGLVQCYMLNTIGRKLTYNEMEEYINKNCKDLGEEGVDSKTGRGLFILPNIKEEYVMPEKRYNSLDDVPSYAKQTIEKLINNEFLKGNEKGLDLSEDMIRMIVLNDRAGLYDNLYK